MLARKTASSKKKGTSRIANGVPLDSSLTSMDWLPKMQIGENSPSASSSTITTAVSSKQASPDSTSLPTTAFKVTHVQYKLEANDVELPTSTAHVKPPYSYVTLIRQAILSADMQRMTLNEIYQWILEAYPYFRTAPAKWKNSIRHNLSLNKCFKRLQRSSDDPGKGSYWTLDESDGSHSQVNSRRRRFDSMQPSHHLLSSSPHTHSSQSTGFYSNQSSMIYGDINSTSRQSSSADESETTISSAINTTLISWDDFNTDLSASFRHFRQQVFEVPTSSWVPLADTSSTNSPTTNPWNYDMLPSHESNTLFNSVKLASSGEINWSDVDVKPYCDDFRTNPTLQYQDRDKLLNLASSISSFFDYTGIANIAQNKISNESVVIDRSPIASNQSTSESTHNFSSLPIVVEEEAFDWDSITLFFGLILMEYRFFYPISKEQYENEWTQQIRLENRTDIYFVLQPSMNHPDTMHVDYGLKLRNAKKLELKKREQRFANGQESWTKTIHSFRSVSLDDMNSIIKILKKSNEMYLIERLTSIQPIIICYVSKIRNQEIGQSNSNRQ
ncbi:unnamed protein product [Adineta ricciae]|uniref:Fork-head domain-containing protein n=1 Tax=Adineta ricciae TaxID=249248 RepID=A0A814N5F6_ADIRI|nr:unnamed protein product [Adineta ricciae]